MRKEAFSEIEAVFKECLVNAEAHLKGAKLTRGEHLNEVSYHLAALSLEEVGKAVMLMSSLNRKRDTEDDPLGNHMENHVKKLFWALWSPTITSGSVTGEQIRSFQDLARKIHLNRLAAIYVDVEKGKRCSVSNQDVDTIISLAESRLGMEQQSKYGEPDEQAATDMEWFTEAAQKDIVKRFIWTKHSFDKLAEFERDVKKWIRWIREEFENWEQESKELLQAELQRSQPGTAEEMKPKWKIKIRLRSDSHTFKPRHLASWNKKVSFVTLFKGGKSNELLAELTLPAGIHVLGLWDASYEMVMRFLVALNIGSRGFFWWYLPTYISKFYEEITDLETKAMVAPERNPRLKLDWGKGRVLNDEELSNCAIAFMYIARLRDARWIALGHYIRGLALLAKSDLFLQFEPNMLDEFYLALQLSLKANGDWNGTDEFGEIAGKILVPLFVSNPGISPVLELGAAVHLGNANTPVTLSEVGMMKIFCDAYLFRKAEEQLIRSQQKEKKVESARLR
jgi:AbiV family abortive infection protein